MCYKQKFFLQSEKEKSLLIISLTTFTIQFLRTLIILGHLIVPNSELIATLTMTALPLIADIFVWSGSVALICTRY
uniref:Uncharacterized protein n=1 Tax=Panagrolaimus davidi TaxID=227884 RepID=A0A914PHN7_9BILA